MSKDDWKSKSGVMQGWLLCTKHDEPFVGACLKCYDELEAKAKALEAESEKLKAKLSTINWKVKQMIKESEKDGK